MKPRKEQTEEQRIMRDMGALIISKLPEGASKRFALKQLWNKYPYGYKNFEMFYQKAIRSAQKVYPVTQQTTIAQKLFYPFQPLKSRGWRKA